MCGIRQRVGSISLEQVGRRRWEASLITNVYSDSAANVVWDRSVVVGIAVTSFLIWNARLMGRSFEA